MSKQRRHRREEYAPGTEQVIVETVFKGLWQLATWPFRRGKKKGKSRGNLPVGLAQQLASHWPVIEEHLDHPHTYSLAVSEADKLLDAALQSAALPGKSMGERLQAAAPMFPARLYQEIWEAHKLRNSLAHEVGRRLTQDEAIAAVQVFRNALLHFGVLV